MTENRDHAGFDRATPLPAIPIARAAPARGGNTPTVGGNPLQQPAWTPVLHSTLKCPACGATTRVEMPTAACQFFWTCPVCAAVLRPKPGDCCVFCSWGDVPCPPVQARRAKQ